MNPRNVVNLSVLRGNRSELEQELVQLLFTGTQEEISLKLKQLDPRGEMKVTPAPLGIDNL